MGGIPASSIGYHMAVMSLRTGLWLIGILAASTASADTVLLANGNRFEDVVATVEHESVRVRFAFGEITFAATLVERVEKSESPLASYLAAEATIIADPQATAGAWLDLALGARAAGLDEGYRRALHQAALADPLWPQLEPHMRALDLVFEATAGRWLPYERRLAAAERAEIERERTRVDAAETARLAERRRLLDTLELLALAQLAKELESERRPSEPAVRTGPPVYTFLGVTAPGLVGTSFGWPDTPANRRTIQGLIRRQPGSLLPVVRPRANRSSVRTPGQ